MQSHSSAMGALAIFLEDRARKLVWFMLAVDVFSVFLRTQVDLQPFPTIMGVVILLTVHGVAFLGVLLRERRHDEPLPWLWAIAVLFLVGAVLWFSHDGRRAGAR